MELRDLEYFVAVAEEGNFTRGARRVNIVQSAASAAIARLEREFGQQLFDRAGRRVALNEAGRTVLHRARVLLADARTLRSEVDKLSDCLQGRVSLGTAYTDGRLDLVAVLARFRRNHPQVTLQLQRSVGSDDEQVQRLLDGSCDLALLPVSEPTPTGVVLTPVGRVDFVLACRADDRLAAAQRVGYHDVIDHDFIDFPPGWGQRSVVDSLFADTCRPRRVALEVTDVASALNLVHAGLGLTFVPAAALADDPDLVPVNLERPPPAGQLGLASATARPMSAASRALHRMIVEAAPLGREPTPMTHTVVPAGRRRPAVRHRPAAPRPSTP